MGVRDVATREDRSRAARIAVNVSWARTPDRSERTRSARANSPVSFEYWLKRITDEGVVRPQDRAKAAENAHRAFQAQMSAKAAKTRAARKSNAA